MTCKIMSTRQLKYLVSLIVSRDEQSVDSLPYIGLESIESYTGRLTCGSAEALKYGLGSLSESKSGTRFLQGDVLFGKLRPYLAKAWVAEFEGICTTEALVLRPHSIEPRFLRFFLLSPPVLGAINSATFGSKMPRADWQFIGNLRIPTLPLEEQRKMADYLEGETTEMDCLIEAKERSIELLQERRSSFISAAISRTFEQRSRQ